LLESASPVSPIIATAITIQFGVICEGTALGELDLLHHRRQCFVLGLRAQYFPWITTFNASMSSMASASNFSNRAFWASKFFSCPVSVISMPLHLAREA
jgi:hypothetical protein